jgi:hypothetical protein
MARANLLGAVLVLGMVAALVTAPSSLANGVLYQGTVFVSSDVLTPASPSSLISVAYEGSREKNTFDRRVNGWVNRNSHVFQASYACGLPRVAIVVNAEFNLQEAENQAVRFARILGQLPPGSRKGVREVWVHAGNELAGGGNSSILIHTDYAQTSGPFLEEVFIHEAAHSSLDWTFGGAVNRESWNAAARADGRFISQYAADQPDREDVAESYGAFLVHEAARANPALRSEADRISSAIPNRLNYFRSLGPEYGLSPCSQQESPSNQSDSSNSNMLKKTLVTSKIAKGIQILGASISNNGIMQARVKTTLKQGTQVRLVLGVGDYAKQLTRRVDKQGRVLFKADVSEIQEVSMFDSRKRILVRWNLE